MVEADDKYKEVVDNVEDFFKLDKNNDGVLSIDELKAWFVKDEDRRSKDDIDYDDMEERLRGWR